MSSSSISLHTVSTADHEFIYRLFSTLKADELGAWSWDEQTREIFLRMQFNAHEQHFRVNFPGADDTVVRLGESSVGRLIVLRTMEMLHLADVALLPELRGCGIGSRLIRDLQDEAAGAGVPLRLNCFVTNPAIHLYGRLGFAPIGGIDSHRLMEWRRNSHSRTAG
ncbi:MAG: GNAT family N-acetyltransferase [Sulfuricella sp.]|nr:GNAT family N-acetyltransferase [Sulfuricella sp.]